MTAVGVSLLIVGALVVLFETHVPSYGVLGVPGTIALAVGAVLAVSGLGAGIAVALLSALVVATAAFGLLAVSLRKGIGVRRWGTREHLIGSVGVVRDWHEPTGSVLVEGALWKAQRSLTDEEHADLHPGDSVVVERRTGLTLCVRPAEMWELVR
jgi:membrane-bound ClpP family serine protease